jgi:hypothetical protein
MVLGETEASTRLVLSARTRPATPRPVIPNRCPLSLVGDDGMPYERT